MAYFTADTIPGATFEGDRDTNGKTIPGYVVTIGDLHVATLKRKSDAKGMVQGLQALMIHKREAFAGLVQSLEDRLEGLYGTDYRTPRYTNRG